MIASMPIELFDRGNGNLEVRGPKAIVRIKEQAHGTYTIEGDEERKFPDRGSVIAVATDISGEF